MIKPSEIHIDEHQIFEQKLVSTFGLDDYKCIFATAAAVDVSKDAVFQRKFNFYYRVRRDAQWRNEYYRIFEKSKHDENCCFTDILNALFAKTGHVETVVLMSRVGVE